MITLAVAVLFGMTACDDSGGSDRISVTAPAKLTPLDDLDRIDAIVVPGTDAVAAKLDDAAEVTSFAVLRAGTRQRVDATDSPFNLSVSEDMDDVVCAMHDSPAFAVQFTSGTGNVDDVLERTLPDDVETVSLGDGRIIDLEIFMAMDATPAMVNAIGRRLDEDAEVKESQHLSKADAYEEFKRTFADQEKLVQSASAEVLPESFRVILKNPDLITDAEHRYGRLSGVDVVITDRHSDSVPVRPLPEVAGTGAEVFMGIHASSSQTQAIERQLRADERVASVVFLDHDAAYENFTRDFADQPALLAGASPSNLPESFRIELRSADDRSDVRRDYESETGVDTVIVFPERTTEGCSD